MCLILLGLRAHRRYPLVIAANRDEFHERPTAPAHWWDDAPDILGGRDLRSGGTWLGITRSGRWAALTNYRDSAPEPSSRPSRGELVAGFLRGMDPPHEYLGKLRDRANHYSGFNLIIGEGTSAVWFSNRSRPPRPEPLADGVHGISNHLLDTPWPKVRVGTAGMRELLARPDPDADRLLDLLIDRTIAADQDLPDTGVGLQLERMLSSPFILSPHYGTRSSTALLLGSDDSVILVERSYRPGTTEWTEQRYQFEIGS
jgi:uncharacterized protein with NRDE domain